jgi:hypothetical protein
MSPEAVAFLVLVFGGLAIFAALLAGVSWWSAKPGK